MSNANYLEVTRKTRRDDTSYDRHKLIELGIHPEFIGLLNEHQAKELLKSMLYHIVKKQDGFA